MSPQKSNFSQSFPLPNKNSKLSQEEQHKKDGSCNEDEEETCWSFMRVLANTNSSRNGEHDSSQVYVHPLEKSSSSSALSTQSLEMCTEGLGSETGSSNGGKIMDDLSSSCLSFVKQQSTRSAQEYKKLERNENFPPPLSLIGGSHGIQLRPHREGGRLVLKAVTFCRKSCFQADRSGGRLRLRLFSMSKNEEVEVEAENADDDDEEEEEEDSIEEDEDLDGLESNYSEEIPRPSRCKEEGPTNMLQISLEPFWMVIS